MITYLKKLPYRVKIIERIHDLKIIVQQEELKF